MKRITFIFALIVSLLFLTSCSEKTSDHTHKWEPANCTRGEFCFSCGATQGEALGHTWVDATCDKEKHCTLCGKSEGNPLSHTYDGNGACEVCKQELNNIITLNGREPDTGFVVYGGAVLRFPLWEIRLADSGKFGESYRIYDQTGALVCQGEWNQKMPVVYYPQLQKYNTDYHDTEYIPLEPGIYRLEFRYYTNWNLLIDESINPSGDLYLIPNPAPHEKALSSSHELIVK